MVEHRTPNPGVGGSSPSWPATKQLALYSYNSGTAKRVSEMSSKKQAKDKNITASGEKSVKEETKSSFGPAAIKQFLLEVLAEYKKIVFPSSKVTMGLTAFVLVLVVILSIYLGSIDLGLGRLVTFILN